MGVNNLQTAATLQDYRAGNSLGGVPTAQELAAGAQTQAAANKLKGQTIFGMQYENWRRKLLGLPPAGGAAPTPTSGATPSLVKPVGAESLAPPAQPALPKPPMAAAAPYEVKGPTPVTSATIKEALSPSSYGDKTQTPMLPTAPAPWSPNGHVNWDNSVSATSAEDPDMKQRTAAAATIGNNAKPYSDPMIPEAAKGGRFNTAKQKMKGPIALMPMHAAKGGRFNMGKQKMAPMPKGATAPPAPGPPISAGAPPDDFPVVAAAGGRMGPKPIPKAALNLPPATPTTIAAPQGTDPNSTGQQAKSNVAVQGQNLAENAPGAPPPVLAGEAGPEVKANDDGTMEAINQPTLLPHTAKPGAIIPNKALQELKKKFDVRKIAKKKAAMGGRMDGGGGPMTGGFGLRQGVEMNALPNGAAVTQPPSPIDTIRANQRATLASATPMGGYQIPRLP